MRHMSAVPFEARKGQLEKMPETRCWVAQCLVGFLDQVKLLVVASGSIGVPIGSQSKICLS